MTRIINAKIFKPKKKGVLILDCRTMQETFIANSWYSQDKLEEIICVRGRVKIKALTQ